MIENKKMEGWLQGREAKFWGKIKMIRNVALIITFGYIVHQIVNRLFRIKERLRNLKISPRGLCSIGGIRESKSSCVGISEKVRMLGVKFKRIEDKYHVSVQQTTPNSS